MVNLNGSNAYNMRYDDGAAEKKKKQQPGAPSKKHIRPNMTVKLNKKKREQACFAAQAPQTKGQIA